MKGNMKDKTYNGHKNWTYWNVALWIGNDEGLYRFALDLKHKYGTVKAAKVFVENCVPNKTPDGARWTVSAVRAAIGGLK